MVISTIHLLTPQPLFFFKSMRFKSCRLVMVDLIVKKRRCRPSGNIICGRLLSYTHRPTWISSRSPLLHCLAFYKRLLRYERCDVSRSPYEPSANIYTRYMRHFLGAFDVMTSCDLYLWPLEVKIGTVVTGALRNVHSNFAFSTALRSRVRSPYGTEGPTDGQYP